MTAEAPTPRYHHLYIHVPFCRLVCAYCDFVTVGGRAADMPRYVDALLAELALRSITGELRTIYFGGGTPSLLPGRDIARLIDAGCAAWGSQPREVTVEANPGTRERPDWAALLTAGVTRLSLGVQSLADAQLRALARGHSAAEAVDAYRQARAAGFDNVSIDLIYGIPGQSVADWRRTLEAAIALGPDHLSLYGLQLALTPDEWAAPPRRGALRWRRRMATRQDDDVAATQYTVAEELLEGAGFTHYELSSWTRRGRESLHNLAYWRRAPYTGIGAGAHSFDDVTRSWNERDLDRYLRAVASGTRPLAGEERLDEPTRAFEAMALGLRTLAGVQRGSFAAEFGADPLARWRAQLDAAWRDGLLAIDPTALRLTARGRLLANQVLAELLPEAR